MEELFNPTTIGLHVFNAIILFLALTYFLYKPIRKFMLDRAGQIDTQLAHARDTEEMAHQQLLASEQKLKDADQQAQAVVSKSAELAHEQAQQILVSARKESADIVDQTRQEVEAMVVNAHENLTDEAAELAVEIASRMLGREVKLTDHKQLVDEFVKKVG